MHIYPSHCSSFLPVSPSFFQQPFSSVWKIPFSIFFKADLLKINFLSFHLSDILFYLHFYTGLLELYLFNWHTTKFTYFKCTIQLFVSIICLPLSFKKFFICKTERKRNRHKDREKEKERHRERERMRLYHLLVHSPKCLYSQDWAGLKPKIGNLIQVSHVSTRKLESGVRSGYQIKALWYGVHVSKPNTCTYLHLFLNLFPFFQYYNCITHCVLNSIISAEKLAVSFTVNICILFLFSSFWFKQFYSESLYMTLF